MRRIKCKHWIDTGSRVSGKCAISAPGVEKVSRSYCNNTCPIKNRTKPDLAHGVVGLAKNLVQVGIPIDQASPRLVAARQEQCNSCSYKRTIALGMLEICNHCGCALIPKQRLKSENCPIKKWANLD